MNICVKVLRSAPNFGEESYFQEYRVQVQERATVMSVLKQIYEEQDNSLAFYCSCRIGKCAGCHMTVNAKTCLACTALVEGDITLEPQKGFTVIRDLWVDKSGKL